MGSQAALPRRGTGSLSKALRLLTELGAAEPDALRLTELVGRTNIDSSTAFRMLACLVDEAFLEKLPGKRYRLGPRVFELGLVAGQHVREHLAAREPLRQLAARLGARAFLNVRSGIETVYLEREGPEQFTGLRGAIGTRLPIGVGSGGVALLADMASLDADALIRANERRYRLFGRHTSQVLRRHVDRAKTDGYATTVSFLRADVGSLGIVVPRSAPSSAFALSIVCGVARLQDSDALVAEMRCAAADIARAMSAAAH